MRQESKNPIYRERKRKKPLHAARISKAKHIKKGSFRGGGGRTNILIYNLRNWIQNKDNLL